MRTTHVECASEPGGPHHPNEDFAAVALPAAGQGGALVVLDGVTPPPGDDGCRHSVDWFTQRLGGTLLEVVAREPGRPLPACLAWAISRTADAHRDTCDLSHRRTPQATAVVVRWDGAAVEYLVLSDSVLLIEGTDGAAPPTGASTPAPSPATRRRAGAHPPASGPTPGAVHVVLDTALDRARAAVAGLPRDERGARLESSRNAEGGFWTAAADPSVAARAVHGVTARGEVRALAALTDGVGRYHEVFGLGGWPELMGLLGTGGPRAAIAAVREAERADPTGTEFPRGKPHDDATAVYLGGL